MTQSYVHGYSEREAERLFDQAETLTCLIHHDSIFPPGSRILEAGCGTGAQTCILAGKNPRCEFVSVDISHTSLAIAEKRVSAAGLSNVTLHHADIFGDELPFGMFDHAVFCFVLEHLRKPEEAIRRVMKMVKPGGTVTAIEGDHGSVCFHPESEKALMAIRCQVLLQERAGGDACIGRKLYPLLVSSGLTDVMVSPRLVYADGGRPDLATGFTEKTFIAMIQGIRDPAIAAGLMSAKDFDEGISDLIRSAQKDGTFSYTFYKGRGINP
jgi:SAM-dependent methyltransferase